MRVLADIEVERREIGGAEIVQLRIDAGPVVGFHRRAEFRVELGQPVQHPTFQFRHLLDRHAFSVGEAVQAAQHPAQRVAQPAIQFGLLLEDFRADAQILGGVGHHHPQAQNIDAELVSRPPPGATTLPSDFDILRPCSSIDEAVRQDRLERRPPRVPTASSSDEWNQPRCWSEPSRYRSAGQGRPRASSTKAWVEPDSNQTSTMSMTCS